MSASKRGKPQPAATPKPVQAAAPSGTSAKTAPPSPCQTGAPNVGSGPSAPPTMASQMTVSGQDLNQRAVTRPGEILEAAPGLAVVAHADGGKANQYYLRGYNLDHGTDLAIFVDDMPINLPTHAHGQGYADLNWLMPETVSSLDVRKGPYFADVGDFATAGSLFINLKDSVEKNVAETSLGSFGYQRYFTMGSTKLGGGSLLYAGETNFYNGPWDTPDHMKKFSGLARYSQGTATDGFSATAMAYSNTWTTTEQDPARAIETGIISRYGEIDPSDGGDTSRYSLSARMAQTTDDGSWKANAYAVKYELDLYNDFTWFLTNPVNGDQFQQHDDRVYGGAGASRTIDGTLFGRPTETVFGIQSRYDDIDLALNNTVQRQITQFVLADHVNEGNAGIYAENTVHWTDWLRTTLGWRGDYYAASINSILQPANSGSTSAAIGSPKFRMVFGPFAATEFFVGAGMGYHSNDARATTISEVPGDPTTPESPSPFLVRSRGAEVGVRTKIVPGLDSSVSLFYLHQDSELFFDGDTGETMPGRPSVRTGVEFTNDYRPASWIHVDADLALTRARFLGFDEAQEQTLPVAGRLSGGADRQRAGQLRFQRAVDGGVGRRHARRRQRMVRRSALALHQFAPAHRGRYVSVGAAEHFQRPDRLSFRQWLAHSARRFEFAQLARRSGDLCLWLAAQDRQPVRHVLSQSRAADGAHGGVPERRDGLCIASYRAAGGAAHTRRHILVARERSAKCYLKVATTDKNRGHVFRPSRRSSALAKCNIVTLACRHGVGSVP